MIGFYSTVHRDELYFEFLFFKLIMLYIEEYCQKQRPYYEDYEDNYPNTACQDISEILKTSTDIEEENAISSCF